MWNITRGKVAADKQVFGVSTYDLRPTCHDTWFTSHREEFNRSLPTGTPNAGLINIEWVDRRLGVGRGNFRSYWHKVLRYCTEAVPFYTHQESGRKEAYHFHCCTKWAGVYGCPRKSSAYMHPESARQSNSSFK